MYNRYVPQGDGTYRKSREPEVSCGCGEIPRKEESSSGPLPPFQSCQTSGLGIGSFLKGIFPQGLDVEDLLVILLLLLISGDRGQDGKRALLTLGAYLFL